MLIKRIKLQNIRSFLEQDINFGNGSVLLSGDVGAGKSSVLLAIDFALFGLGRGALSGASLLRNGKKNGFVELNFEIDGKNIIIKRTLKREANVNQDSGYIIIDNIKKELTPMELKQVILNLLNYPGELLTKNKSLIYRYTVYTPQEEMKRILLEDRELRLDILRRVFGIDKYKRVKENADIAISFLKDKRKELDVKISDLDELKKEIDESREKSRLIAKDISELSKEIERDNILLDERKNAVLKLEKDIGKLIELKKQFEINENNVNYKSREFNEFSIEIKDIEKQIEKLRIEVKDKVDVNEDEIKENEKKINEIERNIREIDLIMQDLKTKKAHSIEIINRVKTMDKCPLCMQNVDDKHKEDVINQENSKIKEFEEKIKDNNKEELQKIIKELKEKNELAKKEMHRAEIINLKINNLNELEKRKEKIKGLMEKTKKEIEELNSRKIKLNEEIDEFKDAETKHNKEKQELENIREIIQEKQIEKAGFEKELKTFNVKIEKLEKEINEKLKFKEKIGYISNLEEWIKEYFVNLINIMEKNIMVKVHNDFNTLFQKWFSILVDSELLKIRIDEEFTPLIEQAGHEIEYDFLSGGERTAAALAYRLALNQVINSLISTIKTKDLLVLDEPTEGFSSEQLDRIKLILDELNMKQIILVSHESKIESFVDTIIRFEKKDHVSKII